MIEKLRDALAPRRAAKGSDGGYRKLLRWAALPVTDRRWAAPLAAIALGFGIFAGVAIGPGAAGTLATAPLQVIEMPPLGDSSAPKVESGGGGDGGQIASAAPEPSGFEEDFEETESSASYAPIVPLEEEPLEPAGEEKPSAAKAPPAEEQADETEEQELVGTVVHVNAAASSYTVAETGGVMSAVHAGKLPAPGTEVEVPIEALANGTLAEAGKRQKTGEKKQADLAGIVTFVGADPAAPAYAISNRGSSALVHLQPDPSGALPPLPVLGGFASVTASIDTAGALWQQQLSSSGAPFTHADFEGIVAAVEPEAAKVLISADDLRESGQDLSFAVPTEIDATKLLVGESVLVSADIGADGTLTLTGLASDERRRGADDLTATQGDLVPEKPKGKG